jgi:RNA polymerase sigma factor (sigma-70 family)
MSTLVPKASNLAAAPGCGQSPAISANMMVVTSPIDSYCVATASSVESRWVDDVAVRGGFEGLYRLEYPGLVAVATALTGDSRDAEDLVQDTMVRAFTHWTRVSQLQRPGAWCHRVLHNACRSWGRRRRTEVRFLSRQRHHEPNTAAPHAEVVAFWNVVRTLPDRPRTVVALHFAGERTMTEIASILGVPEGTVRSDIARARVLIIAGLAV